MTGDARMIDRGALVMDDLPMPLRMVVEDVGAHDGAVAVGRVLMVKRGQGGKILGTGDIDVSSPAGAEAARLIGREIQTGVSMDLDDVSFEVRVAREMVDQIEAAQADSDATPPESPVDSEGRVTVLDMPSDAEVMVTTSARLRAVTLVSVPAFIEAKIALDDSSGPDPATEDAPSLAAAGGPLAPPAAWFEDPKLAGPTPFTVTDDGRVYGHLALWDTCHVSFTMQGQCVTPPRSGTGYAHYRLGLTRTREGRDVPTGTVTMNARHASADRGVAATMAHYEDTGLAAADVAAGEDSWGIWVAGALRPGLSDEQVRALRAAPLSGDWRRVGNGNLELVAALAVNTPGFPVPRPMGLVAAGQMVSLVAAGTATATTARATPAPAWLSQEDARALSRLAARERAKERADLDAMAARLRLDQVARLADRVAATSRKG